MKPIFVFTFCFLFLGQKLLFSQCQISAGINQSITCGESIQLIPEINWNPINNANFNNFTIRSLSFVNDSLGYIVGDSENSYFYAKTTDGGVSWLNSMESAPDVTVVLNSVFSYNDTLSFIVGGATFQGQTFEILLQISGNSVYNGSFGDNPISKSLRDVYFVSPSVGYVVGSFGAIGKSTNGGIDWVTQDSNQFQSLNSVHFTSISTGYAVGLVGTIIKTTDGGNNWIPQTSNTTVSLNDIYFVDDSIGYVVGNDGVILKTTNAGNSWIQQISSTTSHLKSINFKPNGSGFIAGQGLILNTTDGSNWNSDYTLDSTLYAVHFPSDYVGYVVGEHGKILKKVFFDTFSWNPASSLNDAHLQNPIATPTQTTTYNLTASVPNGCIATSSVIISVIPMQAPEICIVTVNENNRNLIAWEKPQSSLIDSFFIFKETNITDQYQLMGTIPYTNLSVFEDSFSTPNIQSSRYKISMKDICGLVTEKSAPHKTMHLSINQGVGSTWNLIWEPYVGMPVSTYNIYRGTTHFNLSLIGSTSGSSTQYSDNSAPSGLLYYQIEVVSATPCNPAKSISSSFSNIASNDGLGIDNFNLSNQNNFTIYPNPATDFLTISSKMNTEITSVMIFDIQGKQLQLIQNECSTIDISHFQSGLYILKINTDTHFYRYKFTIK